MLHQSKSCPWKNAEAFFVADDSNIWSSALCFSDVFVFSVFSPNERSLFTNDTVIPNNWMFLSFSHPHTSFHPPNNSFHPLTPCPNSLHLLLPPPQRCLQTPPPIPSSSSSLLPSSPLPSSPAPPPRPGSMFPGLAQSQGPLFLLPQLQLRKPRLRAVGPSQQPACGPPILYEASPTRCCRRPWGPSTPRCTPPWCPSPVSAADCFPKQRSKHTHVFFYPYANWSGKAVLKLSNVFDPLYWMNQGWNPGVKLWRNIT